MLFKKKDRYEASFDKAQKYRNRQLHVKFVLSWHKNQISYVTNDFSVRDLSIDTLIGDRQEGLIQVISDGLSDCTVKGSIKDINNKTNEITDILVHTGHHALIIESKELSIELNDPIDWAQSEKRSIRGFRKAVKQLKNAVFYLNNCHSAYDWAYRSFQIDEWDKLYALVIISDISRLPLEHYKILEEMQIFESETGASLDIIDTDLLYRAVQFSQILFDEHPENTFGAYFTAWLSQHKFVANKIQNLRFDMFYQSDGQFKLILNSRFQHLPDFADRFGLPAGLWHHTSQVAQLRDFRGSVLLAEVPE